MNRPVLAVFVAILWHSAASAQPTCTPHWSDRYPPAGTDNLILRLLPWDDGRGPALFAGGYFSTAGPHPASCIARFDGGWSTLGSGVQPQGPASGILDLAVFDDGRGPALFAAGSFARISGIDARGIARWDGHAWTPLGGGLDQTVHALAVFDDDGPGSRPPALYAAGDFYFAGGRFVRGLARWDGQNWSAAAYPETAIDGYALATFDDGSGPALYLGGEFASVGGIQAENLARWNGISWSPVGGGSAAPVHALGVVDLGQGPRLCALGGFGASPLGLWDGAVWTGAGNPYPLVGSVASFLSHDDGSGPGLYACGDGGVGRWDGQSWTPVGNDGPRHFSAMAVFDSGAGPRLHAASYDFSSGMGRWNELLSWDGVRWTPAATSQGANGAVTGLVPFAGPTGQAMLAFGDFRSLAGVPNRKLLRRDTGGWHDLECDWPSIAAAAAVPGPAGPEYFIRGSPGTDTLYNTAVLRGGVWEVIGSLHINPMLVSNITGESSLYTFAWKSGTTARMIRWDGDHWVPIVGAIQGWNNLLATSFDDGAGASIYLAGSVTSIDGQPVRGVARWDGQTWSQAGPDLSRSVAAIAHFDDGAGPKLHVAVGPAPGFPPDLLVLDSGQWRSIGTGTLSSIRLLQPADDGRGPALFAAGNVPGSRQAVARWDGRAWTTVVTGVQGSISGIAPVLAADSATSLFIAGAFTDIADTPAANIAELVGCPPSPCYPNCDGSTSPSGAPTLSVSDFICFLNRYAASDPRANCDGSTATPVLTINDFVCFQRRYATGCP